MVDSVSDKYLVHFMVDIVSVSTWCILWQRYLQHLMHFMIDSVSVSTWCILT
jgi:hypothetical protein